MAENRQLANVGNNLAATCGLISLALGLGFVGALIAWVLGKTSAYWGIGCLIGSVYFGSVAKEQVKVRDKFIVEHLTELMDRAGLPLNTLSDDKRRLFVASYVARQTGKALLARECMRQFVAACTPEERERWQAFTIVEPETRDLGKPAQM